MKSSEFLKEANMSRAAKGHEKYGKKGMEALAKAGREGAGEKKLDAIRDKHDKYNESYDSKLKQALGINESHYKWVISFKNGKQAIYHQKSPHYSDATAASDIEYTLKSNPGAQIELATKDDKAFNWQSLLSETNDRIRDKHDKYDEAVSEEKQKGVDGKACWKGYKRMGTKQKGGKTVDNCVKMEESNDEYNDEAGMVDSNLETIKRAAEELDQVLGQDDNMAEWAQEKLAVVKSMLVAVKDYVVSQKSTGIDPQVDEEFDMIESIIESLAVRNQVDAEVIWEDLESLTEDELYVFAVTQEPVNEDWQKVNKKDKTDGMSKKAVASYRRENPGSKLKTAVTTKPSKLKKGSKASKRRKSYCSRSKGQMNMHNISCAKTPDKAICKARRRWNC
jgi:DNA-binding transcriptional regulator YdaS (Cro superfamily)